MGHISVIGILVCLVCVTTPTRLPYIVGGKDSLYPGRWPWQGSLQLFWLHTCGCSLISDRWLVTAGHCTLDADPRYLSVVLGAYDLNTQKYGAPKQYLVKKVYTHPDYDLGYDNIAHNDIGLIELKDPVEFNKYVATVQLPQDGLNFEKSPCYMTGWGYVNAETKEQPNILQETATKEMDYATCSDKWGSDIWDRKIDPTENICVAGDGAPTSCEGDSGGPLVCKLGSTWYLAGATSWGSADCYRSLPSVYTRVSSYRSWIKDVSGV